MLGVASPVPPMDYNVLWLVLGITSLVALASYIAMILFLTRHKDIKTLSSLPIKQVVPVDLTRLKAKYLKMIAEVELKFSWREIKSSSAHQQLSTLVRYFAFEACGFRAHLMTLSDIQRADRKHLAETIKSFYAPEFDGLNQGSVAKSAAAAREVVETWR